MNSSKDQKNSSNLIKSNMLSLDSKSINKKTDIGLNPIEVYKQDALWFINGVIKGFVDWNDCMHFDFLFHQLHSWSSNGGNHAYVANIITGRYQWIYCLKIIFHNELLQLAVCNVQRHIISVSA